MNRVKTRVAAYGFVTPAVITLALLLLYPFCYGIYISFFKTNLVNKWNFIGLKNYAKVLTEADFYSSMKITLIFTVGVVLGHFIFGFLFAVMLNRDIKGRTVFRAILLLPWLFPEVVIANLWRWIFNPTMGFLNSTLVSMGILQEPMSWLGSPKLALAVLIFICIWKGYPLVMIQLLAGLQTVPGDIIEAARIDGMNEYQIWAKIMLPLSKPALSTLTIFTFVNTWNDFLGPLIYLKTEAKKTLQLGLKMFLSQYSSEYGLIMAASVLSLIPVLIVFLALQQYFVEGIAATGVKG